MISTLPYVERGLFTFIGATTENPSFEVINALLSRATVYVLHPLTEAELGALFDRTRERVMPSVRFSDAARSLVIGFADGDARRLLNMLEQLHIAAEGMSEIDEAFAKNALTQSLRRFDKGGDQFYDQISALHKSVRGSSPDAALYWLVRMLDGGADPLYIGRRLIRMATEDIGLADPWAARAWHDLFAALGVKPLEEYEGGALFHPVDVANMLEKLDGEDGGMKLLVYATQLQALDRPALRTQILNYWSGPGLANVLYALQDFDNRAVLRMALYATRGTSTAQA